ASVAAVDRSATARPPLRARLLGPEIGPPAGGPPRLATALRANLARAQSVRGLIDPLSRNAGEGLYGRGSIGVSRARSSTASNAAAAESSAASPRGRPTSCRPTGRPSAVKPAGSAKLGQLVMVTTLASRSHST